MNVSGGCHCGAVRYEVSGDPQHVALCHCSDCRRSAGAPMVSWVAYDEGQFRVTKGSPKTFNSSGSAMRSFCGDCGTGLYYTNAEFLPGIVDIQGVTLDDPEATPPQIHIQTAEKIGWVDGIGNLPQFERYPSQG